MQAIFISLKILNYSDQNENLIFKKITEILKKLFDFKIFAFLLSFAVDPQIAELLFPKNSITNSRDIKDNFSSSASPLPRDFLKNKKL